ncbi:MAG TPA: hypothetical protein VJW73_14250 [Gemmatimonadaceae bacterium]|nr:hypothetical protein [Gemmatimonadaceae bacterium]
MVQLTIEVDWKIGAGAMAQPFFLVGTFLPRVIVTPLAGQLSVPRPLFFQSAHLPADIVTAGLQLGAGDWSPIHHPQLELVLFPKQETLAETEEQVLFVGEIARALPASRRADVARSLRNNLTRVASALDINPAVRTALYPHDDPLSLPREGNVLLLDTSEMLGLDETGRGMATQGLAKASAIWWGGGVSISGHVGAALMVGITQALALFCLRDMRPKSHFRTVEIVTRRRADIEVDGSSPAGLRAVKLSGEFGLSLAAALNQGTEVRTALRQMTKEFWGREIPPAVILERLREVGVEPPNGLHGLSGEYES